MNAIDSKSRWLRFSLRELLMLIGFVAVACVSLKYAGFVWVLVLSAVVLLLFTAAVVVALVDRGRQQAAAIGLAAVVAIYGVLFRSSPDLPNNTQSCELYSYTGRLPTSKALQPLARIMTRGIWVDSSGHEIVNYDPATTGSTGMGGSPRAQPYYREIPEHTDFMAVGHLLWALLLGYLGSRLAVWSYDRRTKPESKAGQATHI